MPGGQPARWAPTRDDDARHALSRSARWKATWRVAPLLGLLGVIPILLGATLLAASLTLFTIRE